MNNLNKKQKIILGMSGGVDSSVCAYLLKSQGYDVIGLFMQNWDPYVNFDFLGQVSDDQKTCDAQKDFSDASAVAKKLNLPIYHIEFIQKYWDDVFKYVIAEYKAGNTPNPDVLCNKYIKFDAFINYAKQHFGCDKIAMGHYASVEFANNQYYLTKALDEDKDQTYFLCWLNQEQLSKIVFPIGNLKKTEVRKIAEKQNLDIWNKKDSTGICFIGERKFNEFLKNYIKVKPGKIVDIETNKTLGKHDGIMFYTIGQNRDLGLGGQQCKYFVCKKDIKNNILYVASEKTRTKYLISNYCQTKDFNWINDYKQWIGKKIQVRFRHRMKLIDANFEVVNDKVIINYEASIGVTKGQFAVLYSGRFCLGGGIIDKVKFK